MSASTAVVAVCVAVSTAVCVAIVRLDVRIQS
jgi:hypothetical protein